VICAGPLRTWLRRHLPTTRFAITAAAFSLLGCARCGAEGEAAHVGLAEPIARIEIDASPPDPSGQPAERRVAGGGDEADAGRVAVTPGPEDCWAPGDVVDLQLAPRGFPVKGLRFAGPRCAEELEVAVARGDFGATHEMIEEVRIPDHWPARAPRCRTAGMSTLLHLAAASGSTQVAEYLISKGANVRGCDRQGDTPLHVAAANLDLTMARLLIDKGALVDAVDIEGRRPVDRCFDNRLLRPARPDIDPALLEAANDLAAWLRERSGHPGAK